MKIEPVEGRVVGSLIEKQLTTPQQYPMSLNSLTAACNQTSSRDPVTNYAEGTVREALDRLKAAGLVRFVLPSHGRSVVRYRHALEETLALDARQLALLTVLLLRGPQTVGELRTRTERMADFATTAEVESDLEGLARWEDPLVARGPRQPGQKEERWTHLLYEHEAGPVATAATAAADHQNGLADDVAALRAEVAELRDEVAELKKALGG
jgi:uncharacterized protein YceH (UPF0502 family)